MPYLPSNFPHYSFKNLGYGVLLSEPEGDNTLLQGDDALDFLNKIDKLDEIWANSNPNANIFHAYQCHLDLLIDPYF